MFKYLFLVQVLLAKELYSWKHPLIEEHLQRSLETSSVNPPIPIPSVFWPSYFQQKLNHFDANDPRRWLQRYYISESSYRPGGPIFLLYGAIEQGSAWLEYAKQFGALCVIVERRYYGLSWPTNYLSSENLKYLNSQQELADVANFINNKKWWVTRDTNKLIVFGGGYAGSIAAWLRLKYPHLVDGAVASSARLEHGLAYSGYYKVAEEALRNNSAECASGLKDAFKEFNKQLEHQDGQKQIKELFNFCPTRDEPEISRDDIPFLNDLLAKIIAFDGLYLNASVCTSITNQTIGTPLHRLGAFARHISYCFPSKYVDMVKYYLDPVWFSNGIGEIRQGLYQRCTELGNFPISDHSHVFSHHISFYYYNKLCTDVFGSAYNVEALGTTIANRRLDYGGKDINVTNVVFVQGSKDPWLSLGVVKDVNSKSPAIVIEGQYQLADMMSSNENDSAELKEARKKIASNIETWLKD